MWQVRWRDGVGGEVELLLACGRMDDEGQSFSTLFWMNPLVSGLGKLWKRGLGVCWRKLRGRLIELMSL